MQVLTVDVGTGTQDIFLMDTRLDVENGFKLIAPSPTMAVHRRIKEATRRGEPILLSGVTMGGGPSHWAVEDHIRAGHAVFATPEAARSFNDDLDYLRSEGIQVVDKSDIPNLQRSSVYLELKDFDFAAIATAFSQFGVSLNNLAAVVVGVFDHGAAPPNYSDRKFRFEYLARRLVEKNSLAAFAYRRDEIPRIMTRMQAVADSAGNVDAPLVVMDTAPAAVLGATLDPVVRAQKRTMIANIGNFHTLAFRLGPGGVEGVFEHHTGFMSREKLETLFQSFAAGELTNDYVFGDQGHGAWIGESKPLVLDPEESQVAVIGPRRKMMVGSDLEPYFAAPFGDMMLVGCFGMLAAAADLLGPAGENLREALQADGGQGRPPWEVDR
jgi:uncharacterized protein (DUF1786 family)